MSEALWDMVEARVQLNQPPAAPVRVPIQRRRRRGYDPREADGRAALDLVRDAEGLLRWVYRPPAAQLRSGRRSYRSTHLDAGTVVRSFSFHDLAPNQVTQGLVALDLLLNPRRGLQAWDGAAWQAVDGQPRDGPSLLLVHGTFSESRMFSDELAATPQGQALAAQWRARYAGIHAFDHATLSVGAWSNAVALADALGGLRGPIDIVCHSRGGLVVAWLLRLRALPVRRVIFVGSPLGGTSLASPPRLRAALDMFANFSDVAVAAGVAAASVLPIAAGAAGLARIFGSVLRLGSSMPLVDAGVSLVPGLASQQRVGNNLEQELLLAQAWKTRPELFAIGGHFQPDESDEGWRFWKRFTHIGDQLAYAAADLVFDGENDLVVDVAAMDALGAQRPVRFRQLATSASRHHCSYFRDAEVLGFVGEVLGT